MIYYNLNTINDWNFGDDNIIKVYKHGAVCYYKITSGDTPTPVQEPCFAVVDDITQYSDTEFENVYDKATEKWFKLNNLNAYEEYGIYASGRTSCEGSTSRLPQGYTEVEYVENTSTAYIDTGEYLNTSNFEVGYTFWGNRAQWGYVHQNVGSGAWVTTANDYAYMGRYDSSYRVAIGSYLTSDENTIVYTQSGVTVNGTSISKNLNLSGTDNLNASTLLFFVWYDFYRAGVEHSFNSKVKSFYLKNNGTLVRDFVPAKRDSDNKYGMYDLVTNTFYLSPNNVNFSGGDPVTPTDCVTTYEGKLTIDDGEDYSKYYLTLQALESGTFGFSAGTVNYSTDSGSTWNTLTQGNTISVSQGDEVLFKMSGATPNSNTGIGTFTSSGRFNVYGNIMSMQESDNFATATTIANYEYYFKRLFAESKAVSAEYMVLPATTLRNFCYNELFKGSTYLTTPPKIFPATALTQDCYSSSFRECPSLTKSPILPAPTSARASYGWMFQDSTSLSEVTCLATNVSAQYATYDWLKNVASSGTFYKNPNASWSRGTSGIPSNWSAQDYVEPTPIKYEYQYSGGSWVNLGEVSGSSRVPVGYTEVEYIQNTGTSYLNTNFVPNQDTRVVCDMQNVTASNYPRLWGAGAWNSATGLNIGYNPNNFQVSWLGKTTWTDYSAYPTSISYNRHTYDLNKNYVYIDEALVGSNTYTTRTASDPIGVFTYIGSGRPSSSSYWGQEHFKGKMYSFKVYDNGTLVRDLVPCKRDNDNTVGAYDIVNDVFYTVPTGYTTDKLIAGAETGSTEYPKYYDEIQDPPDNLVFSSMAEAEAYECPWVGMHATIDGDKYVFSGDSQSGYEWVYNPSRLPDGYTEVEYIENTSTAYINTEILLYDSTTNSYNIQCKCYFQPYGNDFEYLFGTEGTSSPYVGVNFRYYQRNLQYNSSPSNVTWTHINNGDGTSGITASCSSTNATNGNNPLTLFCGLWSTGPWRNGKGKFYTFKVTKNNTLVKNLVPAKRDSDDKYGMYDIVNDVFYVSPNGNNFIGGDPV